MVAAGHGERGGLRRAEMALHDGIEAGNWIFSKPSGREGKLRIRGIVGVVDLRGCGCSCCREARAEGGEDLEMEKRSIW